jgi:hypothetical protein
VFPNKTEAVPGATVMLMDGGGGGGGSVAKLAPPPPQPGIAAPAAKAKTRVRLRTKTLCASPPILSSCGKCRTPSELQANGQRKEN